MTERIISADSHLELKPEKILGHLPRQHHEAYQGALMAQAKRILEGKPQKLIDELASLAPLGRLGTPDDIARVVSFLAGPDGAWVNGQVLRANGGIV